MAKYFQKSCQLCKEPNCDGNVQHTFLDGEKQVDYVLVFSKGDLNEKHRQKREMFCQNLELECIELEYDVTHPFDQFIKVHVPQQVLIRYCEILKYKMPIKDKYLKDLQQRPGEVSFWEGLGDYLMKPFKCVELKRELMPGTERKVYHQFESDKEYLFDMNNPNFFSSSVRVAIASYLLERTRFTGILDVSNLSRNVVGVQKLLEDKVFKAAFPLHDGDITEPSSKRRVLLTEWASIKHWIRYQPLDEIKEYFGAHMGLYFAWLGLYTHMLIPPALFGIICVIYGLFTMFNNQISKEICLPDNNIMMCPQCDQQCDYWKLSDACLYSRLKNLFDNRMTVFFAIFMSVWATLYLALWKRYSAKLIHNWGLTDYTRRGEHPRPQYLESLKSVKHREVNEETLMKEPQMPYWSSRFPRYCISYTTILSMISLSLIAISSIIVFRMATIKAQNFYERKHSKTYQSLVVPMITAMIDLLVITLLNYAYKYLAGLLTDLELKRTQTEYDESLSIKIYLFQFVNYYSSMFYLAFIKGKLVGYPSKYNHIFGLRQEECNAGGCLTELSIELGVIMAGKQVIGAFMEMFVPFATKTMNKVSYRMNMSKKRYSVPKSQITHTQWEEDYSLLPFESQFIYKDHLEMVIQFGFISLFVVAFPLAPLFALINNIFEMRLDAKKYLLHFRRPVPRRVSDIGHWNQIMEVLCRISILTNAVIIAFSTDLIPYMVYKFYEDKGMADSFLNFTHSQFNIQDFPPKTSPLVTQYSNVTLCYYESFRSPPDADPKYKKTLIYWQILALRVIFVVLYQNIVATTRLIVEWLIPEVPENIKKDAKWGENLVSKITMNQNIEMIEIGNNN